MIVKERNIFSEIVSRASADHSFLTFFFNMGMTKTLKLGTLKNFLLQKELLKNYSKLRTNQYSSQRLLFHPAQSPVTSILEATFMHDH